jgi:hypothetical protein
MLTRILRPQADCNQPLSFCDHQYGVDKALRIILLNEMAALQRAVRLARRAAR